VTRLLRSELLKLRTVRTLLWVTLGMVGIILISSVSISLSSGEATSAADDRSIVRISAVAVLFAVVTGIVIFGSEGTNGTITQTLLVAPVRERVMAAKAGVAAALGLVLAVLAEVLTVVIVVPGASVDLRDARLVLLGVALGGAVGAAAGVGIGAVFHRQGPAIAFTLLWLLIAENILAVALRDNIKYLPGHVFAAAVSGEHGSEQLVGTWGGLLGAALYAAAFLAAGSAALARRDV
jgi:ABC-2 type transport system permease protein